MAKIVWDVLVRFCFRSRAVRVAARRIMDYVMHGGDAGAGGWFRRQASWNCTPPIAPPSSMTNRYGDRVIDTVKATIHYDGKANHGVQRPAGESRPASQAHGSYASMLDFCVDTKAFLFVCEQRAGRRAVISQTDWLDARAGAKPAAFCTPDLFFPLPFGEAENRCTWLDSGRGDDFDPLLGLEAVGFSSGSNTTQQLPSALSQRFQTADRS